MPSLYIPLHVDDMDALSRALGAVLKQDVSKDLLSNDEWRVLSHVEGLADAELARVRGAQRRLRDADRD